MEEWAENVQTLSQQLLVVKLCWNGPGHDCERTSWAYVIGKNGPAIVTYTQIKNIS